MVLLASLAACGVQAPVENRAETDVAAPTPSPVASVHVIDDAAVLSPATEAAMQARLAGVEARSGKRVLVVTMERLGGRSIDEVSEEIGTRLGLSDGVLLLLATKDRQVRISVGQKSMRQLSDADARRIVEAMRPDLGANRFEAGLRTGVDRIAAELSETIA